MIQIAFVSIAPDNMRGIKCFSMSLSRTLKGSAAVKITQNIKWIPDLHILPFEGYKKCAGEEQNISTVYILCSHTEKINIYNYIISIDHFFWKNTFTSRIFDTVISDLSNIRYA